MSTWQWTGYHEIFLLSYHVTCHCCPASRKRIKNFHLMWLTLLCTYKVFNIASGSQTHITPHSFLFVLRILNIHIFGRCISALSQIYSQNNFTCRLAAQHKTTVVKKPYGCKKSVAPSAKSEMQKVCLRCLLLPVR